MYYATIITRKTAGKHYIIIVSKVKNTVIIVYIAQLVAYINFSLIFLNLVAFDDPFRSLAICFGTLLHSWQLLKRHC